MYVCMYVYNYHSTWGHKESDMTVHMPGGAAYILLNSKRVDCLLPLVWGMCVASNEVVLSFKEEIAPISNSYKELKNENTLQLSINKLNPSAIF